MLNWYIKLYYKDFNELSIFFKKKTNLNCWLWRTLTSKLRCNHPVCIPANSYTFGVTCTHAFPLNLTLSHQDQRIWHQKWDLMWLKLPYLFSFKPPYFYTKFQNMEINTVPNPGLWLKTKFFRNKIFDIQKFQNHKQ